MLRTEKRIVLDEKVYISIALWEMSPFAHLQKTPKVALMRECWRCGTDKM